MDLRYSIGEALGTDYLGLGTGGIPVAADREDAVRDRRPFNPRTGLPDAAATGAEMVTWYEHARAYTEAKWPNLAPGPPPVGRRGPGHRHHRPHREGSRRARSGGHPE
jgi:hypothetical protein